MKSLSYAILTLAVLPVAMIGCFDLPQKSITQPRVGRIIPTTDVSTPGLCTAGATKCDNGDQFICAQDGARWIAGDCQCGCISEDGRARCLDTCTPDAYLCDGLKLNRCSADGCGLEETEVCSHGCDAIAGTCTECRARSSRCNSSTGNVESCTLDGAKWVESEKCRGGCKDGDCLGCVPGTKRCDAQGPITVCGNDGKSYQTVRLCPTGCDPVAIACLTCKPGAVQCTENTLLECTNAGKWSLTRKCDFGCDRTKDVCLPCKIGTTRCDGSNAVERCKETGWVAGEKCDESCTDGKCTTPTCEEGKRRCDGKNEQRCVDGQWRSRPCVAGCSENTGRCLNVCEPGLLRCLNGRIQRCNAQQWTSIQDCPMGCDNSTTKCYLCKPGSKHCISPTRLESCSPDGFSLKVTNCPGGCDPSEQQCRGTQCAPNQRRCGPNDVIEICGPGGWTAIEKCPEGCDPVTRACKSPCKEGARRCDLEGRSVEICKAGAWYTIDKCEFACSPQTASCVEKECSTGERRCRLDGHVDACLNGSWYLRQKCELGCDPETRLCRLDDDCKSGDLRCGLPSHIEGCNADGKWQVKEKCAFGCESSGGTPSCKTPKFRTIAAGLEHSCGIDQDDGSLWCWGSNRFGQLGLGHLKDSIKPARLSGGPWQSVGAHQYVTCAIDKNRRLWCWGRNVFFRAGGDHVTEPRLLGSDFGKVSVGASHACGIRGDNRMFCWGQNSRGQFGNGHTSTTPTTKLSLVSGDRRWQALSAGLYGTCGIEKVEDSDFGRLYCWGTNYSSTLALGTQQIAFRTPTPVKTNARWRSVSIRMQHGCGITEQGIYCWGKNSHGEVSPKISNTIVYAPGLVEKGSWSDVTTGQDFTCAIQSKSLFEPGLLTCWGNNNRGQLGNPGLGTGSRRRGSVKHPVGWSEITSGYYHACGRDGNGTIYCWGYSHRGQTGNGYQQYIVSPLEIAQLKGAHWLETATYNFFVITDDHRLHAWGRNTGGSLGVGSYSAGWTPRTVVGDWLMVSGGASHTCGIKTDHSGWCWGSNNSQRLGSPGGSTPRPRALSLAGEWQTIVAGITYGCGLRNGLLYCWGRGQQGIFGNGTNSSQLDTPTIVQKTKWLHISATNYHMCGIKTDNSLWCWGINSSGQLGDGTYNTRNKPVPVKSKQTWRSVSVGFSHTCAIDSVGKLWCWGHNGNGQLGDGTQERRNTPRLVTTDAKWLRVSVGQSTTCGLQTNATAWCWGRNTYGEVGDGTRINARIPRQIKASTPHKWILISTRAYVNSCAIDSEGRVYCWGSNNVGQFPGLGSLNQTSPYKLDFAP